MAEAVVFFDPALAEDFAYRVKRAGQMAAKGRFFGAQFVAWLEEDHWLQLARHANGMAQRLALGLTVLPGVSLAWPTEANEVFALMPRGFAEALWNEGAVFYPWSLQPAPDDPMVGPDQILVRMVTSFATQAEQVDALLAAANRLSTV